MSGPCQARDRALARRNALYERRVLLVGESVVVLDDVDTGARERVAKRGEAVGEALRLERRAGQRATLDAEHGGCLRCQRGPEKRARKSRGSRRR